MEELRMQNNTVSKKKKNMQYFWQRRPLFVVTVIIPTLIAALYFGVIASDVYISESQFVVRSAEGRTASPFGLFLKGSSFNRSQDDSYTVQNLIQSRDALQRLDRVLNMRHIFNQGDFISRFPGLSFDDSFENLHRYYRTRVGSQVDSVSSITTLTIRAFNAKDAQNINRMLLEMSEELVNRLNERGRNDTIRFAKEEVDQAEKRAQESALKLANYRKEQNIVDPEKQFSISLQQISKLQEELIAIRAQLTQLQTLAKDNPQIPVLQKRAQSLQSEIASLSHGMTGGDVSLASKATEYQRLTLEQEFAAKQLASALTSYENARYEALRQQFYLERISQPSLPDEAMEPRRLRTIISTFVLGLIVWGVLSMLIAGIKEHLD